MTNRTLFFAAALLWAAGCGDAEPVCDDPAGCVDGGDPTDSGTDAICEPGAGLASVGIDPLGRGDGIDITLSDYEGRCYEDDAMEASRPVPPDPRRVAADEAAETAELSRFVADRARQDLEDARMAYEESFTTQETADGGDSGLAGLAYLAAVTLAKTLAEEAYQIGLVILAPDEPTTWADVLEHPEEAIQEAAVTFFTSWASLSDTPLLVDIALDVMTEVIKAEMLDFLRTVRDTAQAACDAAMARVTPEAPEPVADPVAQQAYEDAQAAYDAALAQAAADSDAAIQAWLAQDEPSEFAPCDAEELRALLDMSFCSGAFVNPISDEDEAMLPGIRASLDAYVADLCAAIVVCD